MKLILCNLKDVQAGLMHFRNDFIVLVLRARVNEVLINPNLDLDLDLNLFPHTFSAESMNSEK